MRQRSRALNKRASTAIMLSKNFWPTATEVIGLPCRSVTSSLTSASGGSATSTLKDSLRTLPAASVNSIVKTLSPDLARDRSPVDHAGRGIDRCAGRCRGEGVNQAAPFFAADQVGP